jgi:hemolysin D
LPDTYDTFPFQKYGTLKGTLVWVSPDADEKGDREDSGAAGVKNAKLSLEPKLGKSSYLYKIHISTEKVSFQINGETTRMKSGMTVQADIVTDRRKVIEFFLSRDHYIKREWIPSNFRVLRRASPF